VITGPNLEWNAWANYPPGNPFTEIGDLNWRNYDYSADVRIESMGSACIYGRVGRSLHGRNVCDLNGYRLSIKNDGSWSLCYGNCKTYGTGKDEVLSSGTIPGFKGNAWHNLKLSFNGDTIKAYIDNQIKTSEINTEKCEGMVGMGCGYNYADFDNIKIIVISDITRDSIISGGKYEIINRNSGEVLTLLMESNISGTTIVQEPYTGVPSQKWLLTDLRNGYWSIKNVGNGLSLDVKDMSTTNGINLVQKPYKGANSQQWKIYSSGCYYNVMDRNSEKFLCIAKGSSNKNALIIQYEANARKDQQWKLKQLDDPTSITIKINKNALSAN
jgi:hypothetical protein